MAATGTETATTAAAAAAVAERLEMRHVSSRWYVFFCKFCFLFITLSFLGYLNTSKRPWQQQQHQ